MKLGDGDSPEVKVYDDVTRLLKTELNMMQRRTLQKP